MEEFRNNLKTQFIDKLTKKTISMVVGGIAVFVFLFNMIGVASPGEYIVLQYPTGQLTVIDSQGPYFEAFGTDTHYQRDISVNFTGGGNVTATSKIAPIKVRFLDTSTGEAQGIARFRIPSGNALLKIHESFNSQDGLLSSLLNRVVTKSAKSSARIMSVERHYSGGNSQLASDFDDQLRNGSFITEQVTTKRTVRVAGKNGKKETLQDKQRVVIKKKLDPKTKEPLRNSNDLMEYGIGVISASIEEVDYEANVDSRLERQKAAAADEALARQDLKKAEQQKLTAIAQGAQAIAEQEAKSLVTMKKATTTAQQAKEVAAIQASQKVAVAKQGRLEAVENLAIAGLEAKSLRTIAAARQKAKKSALDPKYVFDEQQKTLRQANKQKFAAFGEHRLVPDIVIGGGRGKGSKADSLMDMLLLSNAQSLQNNYTSTPELVSPK